MAEQSNLGVSEVRNAPAPPAANLLRRILYRDGRRPRFNNYLRGVSWSPDGTCLLSNSQDRCVRLFETQSLLPETAEGGAVDGREDEDGDRDAEAGADHRTARVENRPSLCFPHGEIVYDMAWHPKMNSSTQEHCFLMTAAKNLPISLYDAFRGKKVAGYPAYRLGGDDLQSPLSLTVSDHWIYAGYSDCIRSFDIEGSGAEEERIETGKKISSGTPQRGIVSALELSSESSGLLAAGSYGGDIALYAVKNLQQTAHLRSAHPCGVTQVKMLREAPMLFSAGRKEDLIKVWDLRYTKNILAVLPRVSRNNQRVWFDTCEDRLLISGSQDGYLRIFDLMKAAIPPGEKGNESGNVPMIPTLASLPVVTALEPGPEKRSRLAVVNGVDIHPKSTHLDFTFALCTGGRLQVEIEDDGSGSDQNAAVRDSMDMSSDSEEEGGRDGIQRSSLKLGDNAVSIWRIN